MILAAATALLVLVDDTFADHPKLADWWQAVLREGNFTLAAWDVVPRCTALQSDRLARVQEVMARIRQVRPGAVQIWGSVAMPATGAGAPDGHIENMSALWSDVPYAFPNVATTDTRALVTNGLATQLNLPGDGRWDRSYYTGFTATFPIARVSFAELRGIATQPFETACYSGPPVPPVDENAAFDAYLERNLAYREGRRAIRNRSVFSYRPDMERVRPIYKTMLPGTWVDVNQELPDPREDARYWFGGTMPEAWWRWLDADCEPARVLWFINFRSNAWEWQGYRQGLPRALTFGPLVSVWGNSDWKFGPSRTVADDILRTWQSFTITGVGAIHSVAGDLTLPYFDYPNPVVGLTVRN